MADAPRSGAREAPDLSRVRSPKLTNGPEWYKYYAGYAEGFVDDFLAEFVRGDERTSVLDPWNGSGTTTALAHRRGLAAWGFDLNPVLTAVAKARVLDSALAVSATTLARDIVSHSRALEALPTAGPSLLGDLFDSGTASRLWSLARAINHVVGAGTSDVEPPLSVDALDPLACIFVVALFAVARRSSGPASTSNPTWISVRKGSQIKVDRLTIEADFLHAVDDLVGKLRPALASGATPTIRTANASSLPIPDGSIDLVLTSPPYCTRIDYGVATLPELAALGNTAQQLKDLRTEMLGSPLTGGIGAEGANRWGATAADFLKLVASHPSKASETYYTYYFQRYFAGLANSFQELNRVASPSGAIAIVAQDSFYKEVPLDLQSVVGDMLSHLGWRLSAHRAFPARTLAAVNPRARKYRSNFTATESVLLFER